MMMTAKVLVIVGAIAWGLLGVTALFGNGFNLVNWLLGSIPVVENIVYTLVGVSGLYLFKDMY
jgi:hypothetical protein